MKLLITHVTVCDIQSEFNGKKCDVLISNGVIEQIRPAGKLKVSGVRELDATGYHISPGFVDMRASLKDPGYEYKETLETAAAAAIAGGFTTVACLPDTHPVLQSKNDIAFIYAKAAELPVHILPYGAITRNLEGKEMNELYDMHLAGAVAFTDGNHSITQAGVMERALEYSKIFNGLILSHAEDPSITGSGQMHEGETSTNLGLKGIPGLSEELIVNRDIELARYTKSPVHFSHLSSKGSVDLIRRAKKSGLKVSADVAVANLVWTDEALSDFDSQYKLVPPLRSAADRKALWNGLADGTIDCIVSDHTPEDMEHKDVEFEYASPGITQLQTAFALLVHHAPAGFNPETIIAALTKNPRQILKQRSVSISEKNPAELTVYSMKELSELTTGNYKSKSKNTPLLGKKLKGKIIAVINKDKLYNNS